MLPVKAVLLSFLCVVLLSLAASLAQATRSGEFTTERGGWATARRDSAGLAPDPQRFASEAIVQVYAAPTYGWKGAVASVDYL